jgi:hypothetical protein
LGWGSEYKEVSYHSDTPLYVTACPEMPQQQSNYKQSAQINQPGTVECACMVRSSNRDNIEGALESLPAPALTCLQPNHYLDESD